MLDQYNAGQQMFHAYFNDAVMYVNPYFTISRRNYTRHIFNGTQRIATEIGTSDLSDCIDTTAAGMERLANARAYMQSLFAEPIELRSDTGVTFVDIDGEAYDELQWQCGDDDRLWQMTMACDSDILLPILRHDSGAADTRVSGRYFYHTDHLGSANWVTKDDEAVQFIHYMPYGEMWYNQRGSAYNERYKYTGKERDEETGNDYFGARYYAAYTPMWLSPDPLMDKYPSISPYAYCNWNPMKYVDPDGKKIVVGTWYGRLLSKLGVNNYEAKVTQELEYLKAISPQLNTGIRQLEDSQHKYYIKQGNNNQYNRKDKTITYDQGNDKRKDGAERPSKVALAHEVGHAVNDDNNATVTYDKSKALNGDVTEQNKMILNEITSIEYENEVRANEKCDMRSYNYLDND